ncbi:DUF1800 family protein, partial [Sulfurovum sp. bin170]|uniref:DUF1800 family protein n=1 Tax=Sulfurovum sp. bin170 TaxID=2695268 RepID=UPI0013DEF246
VATALLGTSTTALIAGEELIKNGSFENFSIDKDNGKWKLVQFDNWNGDGEVWNHQLGRTATEGIYKAELDVGKNSVNSLTQTVSTVADETYLFSLDAYARRAGTSDFELLVDGESIGIITPSKHWDKYGVEFIGKGGEQTVSIKEIASQDNGLGTVIDNISVQVTKEIVEKFMYDPKYNVTKEKDASRFLARSTFGANLSEIQSLDNYDKFLDTQFKATPTYFYDQVLALGRATGKNFNSNAMFSFGHFNAVWLKVVLESEDQLRQRVAFALSQIFVVGKENTTAKKDHVLMYYYDILVKNSFGNYRDLLEEVTLSPIMGTYLTMINNHATNIGKDTHPDENYAREVMQLFSVGLSMLNIDGTVQLSNGEDIPTYTQSDIEGLAKVFTGFTFNKAIEHAKYQYADRDTNRTARIRYEKFITQYTPMNWHKNSVLNEPMTCMEERHEVGEKVILNNTTIPAGQSCFGDLEMALDTIFNHPNVGPFFSKQLIQKLVTSNPSPSYIARVATIFNDNGEGVRGDLKAVIRAILLDENALAEVDIESSFGKIKEPVVRFAAFMKAFETTLVAEFPLYDPANIYDQTVLHADSVFNFYQPDFSVGKELFDNNLVAPELQIATAMNVTNLSNTFKTLIYDHSEVAIIGKVFNKPRYEYKHAINLNPEYRLLLESPELLIERYNLLLMQGNMSDEMKVLLKEYMEERIASFRSNGRKRALLDGLFIIMNSPQQNILN